MKKIRKYKKSLINILILVLIVISLYYLAKSAFNIRVRVLVGIGLLVFFFRVFLRFKDVFRNIRDKYGETAARLFLSLIHI